MAIKILAPVKASHKPASKPVAPAKPKASKHAKRPGETNVDRKRRTHAFQPTGTWIRAERRLAIYLRDEMSCAYCGRDLSKTPPDVRTLDHVVPLSATDRDNSPSNLVLSCKGCNATKGDGPAPKAALARIKARTSRNLDPYVSRAKALILAKGSYLKALASV